MEQKSADKYFPTVGDGSGLARSEGLYQEELQLALRNSGMPLEALRYPIDAVLLDNMDVETMKKAVKLVNGRVVTEASGGVTLETVGQIAKAGVDVISVGALTNAPRSLDSSLEWAG